MKRLFIILVALFMFANVSFAQKQETFFGVKFGASEQEVIDAFKKQGLVIAEEDEGVFLFSPAKEKEFINYFNHDWDRMKVWFLGDKLLSDIEFTRSFKSEELALKNYESILSDLSSIYEMEKEEPINIVGSNLICLRVNSAYFEDFYVSLYYCQQKNDDGTICYVVSLNYKIPEYRKPEYYGADVDVFIPTVEIEEVEEEEVTQTIFTVIEESAMFPGGQEELMKYISENLRYPQQARETGTQGLVYVTFVVERDGSLTDIKILRDIGSGCGEEAVRIVKSMPKWIPAKQRGKAVRMQFNLPVKFTLPG
jgi:TonB family protein